MNKYKKITLLAVSSAICLGVVTTAQAEAPMVTDDAGTLDKGGKKVEGSFAKASSARSLGLTFGFAPIDNVELGATLQNTRDSSVPVTVRATNISAK